MDRQFNEVDIDEKELLLQKKLERVAVLEAELAAKEKEIKSKKAQESAKKQVLLRLAPSLWEALAQWAEEDFRSINGQIEYLLSEAVRDHKKI